MFSSLKFYISGAQLYVVTECRNSDVSGRGVVTVTKGNRAQPCSLSLHFCQLVWFVTL